MVGFILFFCVVAFLAIIFVPLWAKINAGDYILTDRQGDLRGPFVSGGYKVDGERKIVIRGPGEKPSLFSEIFGGLQIVGIRGLDKIFKYKLRWIGFKLADGKLVEHFYDEELTRGFCRPENYPIHVDNVQTKLPERIPVNLIFLFTLEIEDPIKLHTMAPENWVENVQAQITSIMAEWVRSSKTFDELLGLNKGVNEDMWEEIKQEPYIKFLRKEWGVKVTEKEDIGTKGEQRAFGGIRLFQISMTEEYQRALAKQKQEELLAKGKAAETMGAVLEMMAISSGLSRKQVQKEIRQNKKMRKEFLAISRDLTIRALGLKGGAYLDIRVDGAEGIEKSALNFLGAFGKLDLVKKGGNKSKKKSEKEEDGNDDDDEGEGEVSVTQEDIEKGGDNLREFYQGRETR
jgi:hypothetical protein